MSYDRGNYPDATTRWDGLEEDSWMLSPVHPPHKPDTSLEAVPPPTEKPHPRIVTTTIGYNADRGPNWRELDLLAKKFGVDDHTAPEILYRLRDLSTQLSTGNAQHSPKATELYAEIDALKTQASEEASERKQQHDDYWVRRVHDTGKDERESSFVLGYD